MRNVRIFVMIVALCRILTVQAGPLPVQEVPEPLKPWINWVLQDTPDHRCPFLYNAYEQKRCAWPSRLILNLDEHTGEFSFAWKVYAESWVQLPGDTKSWPVEVSVNDKAALIMERQAKPFVKLPPGDFRITGRFRWEFVPDNLLIPDDIGLISLTVQGKVIDFPLVKKGQLWLKGGDSRKSVEDRLDLQVFRRIEDDVPLQVTTRLELQVAGKDRELKLPRPLLDGFIPMRLSSLLPARLEPDGSFLVQLRPGRWRIELLSRHVGPIEDLGLNNEGEFWPEQEIWVFAAYPHLRLVEIENVASIDAQLTNLPEDWKSLPAYRLENGDRMHFKVIRRGDPEPEPDSLSIKRTLWLDFEGKGYTVNDQINGRMTRSWRLNALPQIELGKVSLDGRDQPITHLPGSEQKGIEVRKGEIAISADSRIGEPIDSLNAVGWEQSFQTARAELNLPPGWGLFAAEGVDNVPESWISRWTLLDLFLVLIAALAVARMWNRYWAVFALVTLALIWHERNAPQFIWLNILAALALIRVLPQGRLRRFVSFYRNASWLALLVIVVPFMVDQVRMGLYPQLANPWLEIGSVGSMYTARTAALAPASAPRPSRAPALEQKVRPESIGELFDAEQAMEGGALDSIEPRKLERIDPNARVQTGPGLPQWKWTNIGLSWNGPVDSAQSIRFWYLTPGFTRFLNFMRALMVAALAALMFGLLKERFRLNACLVWLLILPLWSAPLQPARADFPEPEMLEELKSRLLKAPDCLPSCAQIAQMIATLDQKAMTLDLTVDIQEKVAFPLPGRSEQWIAQRVAIDGRDAEALYRDSQGVVWTQLDPGQFRLQLRGMIPPTAIFSLPLPLNPHRVEIKAEGWQIEGLDENRSPAGQLHFIRQRGETEQDNLSEAESGLLPAFVRVERTLQLGLDWRVKTRIIRVTPPGAAIVLEIPLLTGESVTSAAIRVRNGSALVNMRAGQQVLEWESVLEQSSIIRLEAEKTEQSTEVWRADVSPIWHMDAQGIAVVHHQDQRGHWLPEWRPWPGEAVTLMLGRPEAVSGQTLTIDHSRVQVNPGKRVRETTLDFSLRSSQGTQHVLTLPTDAILQSVSIDGRTQPIRQQGREVTIPISPGRQDVRLNWREAVPISSVLKTPELNLGIDSVNTTLKVVLGRDRWTLFTSGPAFGPAVLFWGILLVIVVISVGLGKIPLAPLKHWQWFLLLVGLSQIAVAAALLVVGWFLVLGYRRSHPLKGTRSFNFMQFAIALWTLVSLSLLFVAINQGLLGSPEMQISGNRSNAFHLNWYQDRSPAILPEANVISVPLAAYRVLMLAWSLWLAVSLLNWLKWGWGCFVAEGIWKKTERKKNSTTDGGLEKKTE